MKVVQSISEDNKYFRGFPETSRAVKEHNINEGYTKAMMVFINMAKRYGAKLVTSKGKHLKFRDGLGHQISAPKTSSDFRAIRNFQSELRQ